MDTDTLSKPQLEIRQQAVPVEFRPGPDDNSPGTLTGYAAVFDKWSEDLGWFREIIRKGAFTESLNGGADIRASVDHDTGRIIGRNSANTLSVRENDKGLRVEIDLPNTTDGRDLAESVQRGDIDGMSIGFNVTAERWTYRDDDELDERELLAIELFEVSAVSFPAYADTTLAKRSHREHQDQRAKPSKRTPFRLHRAKGAALKTIKNPT